MQREPLDAMVEKLISVVLENLLKSANEVQTFAFTNMFLVFVVNHLHN